jgi:N-methylhydantoinase B
MTTASTIDTLTLTVVWRRVMEICEGMGTVLKRTAYSAVVREAEDCAVGLFDRRAELIGQAVYTPGQVGTMPFALRHALEAFPAESLSPGDGILLNDSYMGNGHLPDVFCFTPVFSNCELVGYAGTCAHHLDVGGAAPGSQATEGIVDIYQEGMRILPVKGFVEAQPVEDVFRLITGNVRRPKEVRGDLRAQMSACLVGARRVAELYDDYGTDVVEKSIAEILSRTEHAMRKAIAAIPDGRYDFHDQLDDYGPNTEPLEIRVSVEVNGESVHIDFTGSSPQARAALNSPYNFTYAYSLFAIRSLTDPTIPETEGTRKPVSVHAPSGCFLNPTPPAATGARASAAIRIVDAVMGAMVKAVPDKAVAAPSQFANTTFGGLDPTSGEPFVYYELLIGGFGARPNKDGVEGLAAGFNTSNIPVEVTEATTPISIEQLAFIEDSAGAGRYRGGCAIRKDIKLLVGPVHLTNLSDRYKHGPWGLAGGHAGATGSAVLEQGGRERSLQSKLTCDVNAGTVIRYSSSGAGGWGHPFERDPQAVLDDVIDGYVSQPQAFAVYGVQIDTVTATIDVAATEERRQELRRAADEGHG